MTDPTRTLIDLASTTAVEDLEIALHSALRRGLTSIGRLERRAEAHAGNGKTGTRAVRALLALAGETASSESPLEVRMLQLIRRFGLPPPVAQHEVAFDGRKIRFDFAYPAHKLAIEVDGHEFHSSRASWQADRARQNLAVAGGWTVLRYTKADLDEHDSKVASTIRDLLQPRLL